MKAQEEKRISKAEDVTEYIDLLSGLTKDEKIQLKGIMIGMQLTREQAAKMPA